MRIVLMLAVTCAVPLLADTPASAADKPADLIIGKWAGTLKIGDAETTLEFEFTKDGKAAMTVSGMTQGMKYWVLHNGDLLFFWQPPVGAGRAEPIEVPCTVTKDRLKMDVKRHEGIQWPAEYKRVN
jgi:hypothetical protein